MKAPGGPPDTHPQDWLKIDVSLETICGLDMGKKGPLSHLKPSHHGLDWLWISMQAITDAFEVRGEPVPPLREAESDRPAIQPSIDPRSFTLGVRAMHDAICAAKYDALQRGELDLQRFDVFAVTEPKP